MKTAKDALLIAKENLNFSFSVPADLSPQDRETLYDVQADVILSDSVSYPQNVVDWATKRRNGSFYGVPYNDYSVSDAVSDFASEIGNQAVSLNNDLNPFSEKNRKWVLTVVVISAILYFAGPPIVKALTEGKASK